jgi:hypothetical protein
VVREWYPSDIQVTQLYTSWAGYAPPIILTWLALLISETENENFGDTEASQGKVMSAVFSSHFFDFAVSSKFGRGKTKVLPG